MKLILIFALLIRAFSFLTADEQLVTKLQNFVDENPKITVDSKDCEMVIYDKEKAKSRVPHNTILTQFSGELPSTRDTHNPRFFFHGSGWIDVKYELLYHFNLVRSHK